MISEILELTLKTADIHAQRLTQVQQYLAPLIPMSGQKLQNLPMDDFVYCETFVSRFSKLQDLMGAKLFGLTLDWAQEGPHISFLDKLNALEKLGCITDAQKWIQIREVRNFLSHEYPDDPERMAGYFNQAFQMAAFILSSLENIRHFIDETTRKRMG